MLHCAKLPGVPSFTIEFAQVADTPEILSLQELNHVSAFSDEDLAAGFVTTHLSPVDIAEMCTRHCLWVARSREGSMAAYACAKAFNFHGESRWQKDVKALFPLHFEGALVTMDSCFQYGPVCVAEAFRGQGVLEPLVHAIKAHYEPEFQFGITFIDVRNLRSLAAHERKLGFRRLAFLPFDDVTYHLLVFRTQ